MTKRMKELFALLKALNAEFAGKAMPADKGAEYEAAAAELKTLQDAADREEAAVEAERKEAARAARATEREKEVKDGTVPADEQPDEAKAGAAAAAIAAKTKIVGYVSIGAFVAASQGMAEFLKMKMPQGGKFPLAEIKHLHGKRVGLTAEQVREFKAIPVIGDNVIIADVADTVRVTEQDRLTMRDVLNVRPTTKDAIRYTRIVGFTRGAATVAPGDPKPQAALELDSKLAPVYTIAVWIPVQNEQMSDLPELQNIIDTELLYDVRKHEEELVVYGSGTDEFLGIAIDPDVPSGRVVVGDTLIDKARRGITDVRLAGYDPNAILASPLDWETIVLEKGSDNRYVWVVVTDGATQRLWGVPVIETIATHDTLGPATGERNLIIGDFMRGATLWDRSGAVISAGWINDQFIRNQRTLLAEERAAFAVRRPKAFVKYETQATTAS